MEGSRARLRALHRRLLADLGPAHLRALRPKGPSAPNSWAPRSWALCLLVALFAALFAALPDLQDHLLRVASEQRCVVSNNFVLMEASRPPTECASVCAGVEGATELRAPTRATFAALAYASRPVVVRGGAADWSALSVFGPAYFRSVYEGVGADAYDAVDSHCQFFPFRTEFASLREALNMAPERIALEPGTKPWYVGWSNCDPRVAEELRRHYQRPPFLPEQADTSATDWIFMGGPGPGASMHLDYVSRPSWQAQISGSKTWRLAPPPECEHLCTTFNLTVNKGDIVLIDTNQWYHDTYVNPGELSITIGSEYG